MNCLCLLWPGCSKCEVLSLGQACARTLPSGGTDQQTPNDGKAQDPARPGHHLLCASSHSLPALGRVIGRVVPRGNDPELGTDLALSRCLIHVC